MWIYARKRVRKAYTVCSNSASHIKKCARSVYRAMVSHLRIGYVNVRGLSRASWEACHQLLTHNFDYLFVAETWFVDHRIYHRDRRLIASTPPPPKKLRGHPRGGIYLLGSHHARSNVDHIETTEFTITFRRGKHTFTGVYFPPTTLDIGDLAQLLDQNRHSTVIMGDINTRFRDPEYQAGESGPPERLSVFNRFLTATQHRHLKPDQSSLKLTTDHCFVRSGQATTLRLLDNAGLRMDTDHKYTLSLTLGTGGKSQVAEGITRFRVRRIVQPRIREKMTSLIDGCKSPFDKDDGVDAMNAKLVRLCQDVQERVVGKASANPNPSGPPRQPSTREQTLTASIRLYKQAAQASKENEVIFPTPEAQSQGRDAATEILDMFKQRWQGQPFPSTRPALSRADDWTNDQDWTIDQVVAEIAQQSSEKSCGADGIHIQFLKAMEDTRVVSWLLQLYNRCLSQGVTPRSWNRSEIYLLTKDVSKRRDANNLRPISIICIFRKVFERLLLLRFQGQPWAQLHPAQAGFRRGHSTYTNAAIVHALLSSKARSTVVFLDFKSAFDVVDHDRLDAKLAMKGCPTVLRPLIRSLMFVHLESRILINGMVTDWFPRSRGVLQGSPLSPWLFNLFIDDLLYEVNAGVPGFPICFFYADDGTVITDSKVDIHQKLRTIECWTTRNAIFLNPAKCAVLTSELGLAPLLVYGQEIPQKQSYSYLGFPVTVTGIDFHTHLEQRIQAATGRARWLGVLSDTWGPAHRLRIYKQFLAPMFEYGAPLVWAWAVDNRDAFDQATTGFKALIAWITNTSDSRHLMTANLCGLSTLARRFQQLRTGYQLVLHQMPPASPLNQLIHHVNAISTLSSFACNLRTDRDFARFQRISRLEPTIRTALSRFLRVDLYRIIEAESLNSHLTSLIPTRSRRVPGLFLADISFAASIEMQSMLLQYRRGLFMHNCTCVCDAKFRRGHETCPSLKIVLHLSRTERECKRRMQVELSMQGKKFTDIDYLINSKQLRYVASILSHIQEQLKQLYSMNKMADSSP